jgi:hypothetical protein
LSNIPKVVPTGKVCYPQVPPELLPTPDKGPQRSQSIDVSGEGSAPNGLEEAYPQRDAYQLAVLGLCPWSEGHTPGYQSLCGAGLPEFFHIEIHCNRFVD